MATLKDRIEALLHILKGEQAYLVFQTDDDRVISLPASIEVTLHKCVWKIKEVGFSGRVISVSLYYSNIEVLSRTFRYTILADDGFNFEFSI